MQSIKFRLPLSLLLFSYWFLSKVINVYHYPLIGVLYEILWFPMVAMLLVLPIQNGYFIIKNQNRVIHYFILGLNLITLFLVFIM
jgi:hypothetical protein